MASTADLAQLALSLQSNEVFQQALDNARGGALEALAVLSISDAEAFYRHQATIRVVDEIRSDIEAFVRVGKPKNPPGIA